MTIRAAVHIIAAVAGAISLGSVSFVGVPDTWLHNIVAVGSLIVIACNIYLGSTSTGINAAGGVPPPHDGT